MLKKIPNILTIGRIIIVPFFVLAFYLPGFYGDLTALILFIVASFTDFLDGMLARMFGVESKLGELLDQIEGIGAIRKRALLNHFGSARSVESASLDEIKSVEGVEEKVAKKIYNFFHEWDLNFLII